MHALEAVFYTATSPDHCCATVEARPMEPLIPYFYAPSIPLGFGKALSTPGLLLFIGILAGLLVASRKARRDGLDSTLLVGFVPWLVVGIVVGGHLGYLLFYAPEQLTADPLSLFRVWQGQSSYGGFLTCAILGAWYFRRKLRATARRQGTDPELGKAWGYYDAVLYGLTLGWFFGRMGCFSIHDHPGIETHFWLGVYGICPGGDPRSACHDLGLYEGLFSLLLFAVLTVLERKPRFFGFNVALVSIVYGVARFLLDTLRHPDVDSRYFGLTPGQYGSVLLLLAGLWIWQRRDRMPRNPRPPDHAPSPLRKSH
jgi:phosphatidylglycerol:prolipoprotein diacylglycerol transferase